MLIIIYCCFFYNIVDLILRLFFLFFVISCILIIGDFMEIFELKRQYKLLYDKMVDIRGSL